MNYSALVDELENYYFVIEFVNEQFMKAAFLQNYALKDKLSKYRYEFWIENIDRVEVLEKAIYATDRTTFVW